jgi:hypothetical protein
MSYSNMERDQEPEVEEFELEPIGQVTTEDAARSIAIDWQEWQSNQQLSYGELGFYAHYFEQLADKFNLTDEFKENGIL